MHYFIRNFSSLQLPRRNHEEWLLCWSRKDIHHSSSIFSNLKVHSKHFLFYKNFHFTCILQQIYYPWTEHLRLPNNPFSIHESSNIFDLCIGCMGLKTEAFTNSLKYLVDHPSLKWKPFQNLKNFKIPPNAVKSQANETVFYIVWFKRGIIDACISPLTISKGQPRIFHGSA
jgi:hypothetical protein